MLLLALLTLGATFTVAYAAPPPSPASTTSGAPASNAAAKGPAKSLGTVTVHGEKMTPLRILCTLRGLLEAQFSPDPAKADNIVCRAKRETGSHFTTLWCLTNRQYFTAKANGVHWPPGSGGPRVPVFTTHGATSAAFQPVSPTVIRLAKSAKAKEACQTADSEHGE